MSVEMELKTCCGCLRRADLSTMYYFIDPVVVDLFQSCTNIWIQPDHYTPQQLCALCYKQCEVWKYFKQQCEENYTKTQDQTIPSKKKKNGPAASTCAPVTIPRIKKPEPPTPVEETKLVEPFEDIADESDPDDFYEKLELDGHDDEDKVEHDESFGYIPSTSSEQPSAPKKGFDVKNLNPAAVLSIPENSRSVYIATYRNFMTWKEEQGAGDVTEDLMLDHFKYLVYEKNLRSLEQRLSHLKATLLLFNGISIGEFNRLKVFISSTKKTIGPKKKAPVMTREQLMQFATEASDDRYGTTKVVVALWLAGCTSPDEIHEMTRSNVFDRGNHMEVLGVGTSKAQFLIRPSLADGYNPVPMIRNYLAGAEDDFPYLLRRWGYVKCRTGKAAIKLMPKVVAKFLKLPDHKSYIMLSIPRERREKRVHRRVH